MARRSLMKLEVLTALRFCSFTQRSEYPSIRAFITSVARCCETSENEILTIEFSWFERVVVTLDDIAPAIESIELWSTYNTSGKWLKSAVGVIARFPIGVLTTAPNGMLSAFDGLLTPLRVKFDAISRPSGSCIRRKFHEVDKYG